MAVEAKLMTVEDLLAMPDNGMRHELIRGELIEMPPVGDEHGEIAATIAALLMGPIKLASLGRVRVESGVVISRHPATVFGPDVSVLLGGSEIARVRGYSDHLPSIVFEVVSPSDSATDVHDKLQTYLEAGVAMVVAVWPERGELSVGTSDGAWTVLTSDDRLDLGTFIPELSILVSDIFE